MGYPKPPNYLNYLPMNKLLIILLASLCCGACSYTLKIKDGRTAYERKQFAVAAPMLEKEVAKAKTRTERGQLAYLLGDSYRRTGQDERALDWFKTAYDNNYGADALKAYAFGLKKLERYAAAREAFKNLGIEIGSPYEYRKEITACTIAEDWLKQAATNGWKVEAAPFNSNQNDFAPTYFADGRLVFTSDRAMAKSEGNYNWTGQKFMDLFIVEAEAASPQVFDDQLNTLGNEGTACFNPAGTTVYFVRATGAYKGDDAFCKIYVAQKSSTESEWNDPAPLPFQKEKINYLHPALSADGLTLYFASNDPEGWGGYDLYAVQRNTRTETGWDEPETAQPESEHPGERTFSQPGCRYALFRFGRAAGHGWAGHVSHLQIRAQRLGAAHQSESTRQLRRRRFWFLTGHFQRGCQKSTRYQARRLAAQWFPDFQSPRYPRRRRHLAV